MATRKGSYKAGPMNRTVVPGTSGGTPRKQVGDSPSPATMAQSAVVRGKGKPKKDNSTIKSNQRRRLLIEGGVEAPTDMAHYWPLDEPNPVGAVSDSVGSTTLTLQATVPMQTGSLRADGAGGSLRYSGVAETGAGYHATASGLTDDLITDGGFTVSYLFNYEAWASRAIGKWGPSVCMQNNAANNGVFVIGNDNWLNTSGNPRPSLYLLKYAYVTGSDDINPLWLLGSGYDTVGGDTVPGQTYAVTATYNANTGVASLYVDDYLATSFTLTAGEMAEFVAGNNTTSSTLTNESRIYRNYLGIGSPLADGAWRNAGIGDNKIGDVMLWTRCISEEEALALNARRAT